MIQDPIIQMSELIKSLRLSKESNVQIASTVLGFYASITSQICNTTVLIT